MMAIEEVNRIKQIFSKLNINPNYLEHEPVLTSEDASRTRGFSLKQGIKALVFTYNNEWVVVDILADQKVNLKKVAGILDWSKSKIRMATPEEVEMETGCIIGAVPPFGHKSETKILVDNHIFENDVSAFNIGLRTHSVIINTELMRKVFDCLRMGSYPAACSD
ncbi:hypothetical protein COV12_01615 [Candidatus Woesearchaeota archaeon CG10_big_fil_rev_8_21_14_0_10_32_24]|nr:MAG: hypothetical protein COV12_01615 [Candidatus Woesearchaeota archaeon CG10_big_fil_rev_8_21_14_0_10_32_24]